MFELLMIGALVIAFYRIADVEHRSGSLWGLLAFAASIVALVLIPLPMVRILMAGVVLFIVMMFTKPVAR